MKNCKQTDAIKRQAFRFPRQRSTLHARNRIRHSLNPGLSRAPLLFFVFRSENYNVDRQQDYTNKNLDRNLILLHAGLAVFSFAKPPQLFFWYHHGSFFPQNIEPANVRQTFRLLLLLRLRFVLSLLRGRHIPLLWRAVHGSLASWLISEAFECAVS